MESKEWLVRSDFDRKCRLRKIGSLNARGRFDDGFCLNELVLKGAVQSAR
jgi:hypothetical protein